MGNKKKDTGKDILKLIITEDKQWFVLGKSRPKKYWVTFEEGVRISFRKKEGDI